MQLPKSADPVYYFCKKAQYLRKQNKDGLLLEIQTVIQRQLLKDSDSRLLNPPFLRSLIFDLSYLLIRHRSWLHAPLVAELAIDYLSSEFHLPRDLCPSVVENCLDILHSKIPSEPDWDSQRYDEEFLEHLFICSIIAKSEGELAIDIGFGRNILELLSAALQIEQAGANDEVFQFAPELVTRLSHIIQRVMKEHQEKPWILSLYQLKNQLQRDFLIDKSQLTIAFLDSLLVILLHIGSSPSGSALDQLTKLFPTDKLASRLNLLMRAGLIFEERGERSHTLVYRLSHLGSECSSTRFAIETLKEGQALPQLSTLPSQYQVAMIQTMESQNSALLEKVLSEQAEALSPEALRLMIDLVKKQGNHERLLELFKHLLHNQAHAWIRAEICHALPLAGQTKASQDLLDSLGSDDQSPMVRSAAREALQRHKASRIEANA